MLFYSNLTSENTLYYSKNSLNQNDLFALKKCRIFAQ